MPPPTAATSLQLARLIGLPDGPALIDVRIDQDFDADPRGLPGAVRRNFRQVASWAPEHNGRSVVDVASRFGATPFDIEAVFWTHCGEGCTFDAMPDEFDLHTPALDRLAVIVRGADTARPDLAPGLLGLARSLTHELRRFAATGCRNATLRRVLSVVPGRERRDA